MNKQRIIDSLLRISGESKDVTSYHFDAAKVGLSENVGILVIEIPQIHRQRAIRNASVRRVRRDNHRQVKVPSGNSGDATDNGVRTKLLTRYERMLEAEEAKRYLLIRLRADHEPNLVSHVLLKTSLSQYAAMVWFHKFGVLAETTERVSRLLPVGAPKCRYDSIYLTLADWQLFRRHVDWPKPPGSLRT